jgi:hypothetical protein
MKRLIAFLALQSLTFAAAPRDSLPLDAKEWPQDYRLHLDGAAKVKLSDDLIIALDAKGSHDIAVEYPAKGHPVIRVWNDGKLVRGPEDAPSLALNVAQDFPDAKLNFGADFTALATFKTLASGLIFSKYGVEKKGNAGGKALYIREGKLVYGVDGLGEITGGPAVNDDKPHTAVVVSRGANVQLWLDGQMVAEKASFSKPDNKMFVFKIGRAARAVASDFTRGRIANVRVWSRALPDAELPLLFKADAAGANTPDFEHSPKLAATHAVVEGGTGWVQALELSDHAELVGGWNAKTLEEGAAIYKSLCIVCHGTKEQPGSLPTSLRFAEGQFKNGSDPFSMYLTLTKGFNLMVPQPQYTTGQKYAVIQYIRETFVKPHNPSQFVEVTPAYFATLPRGLARAEAEKIDTTAPEYKRMELGPALFWTLQVAPDNIAQKGIAIRLDDGPGGVTKGRAWMIYDHDTMRVAAATTGDFVDWKGIAFDGSHQTHTSLTGEKHFVNPAAPGWASPNGKWDDDARVLGKDGKRYGPLPRDWARLVGVYENGNKVVIAASIHGVRVLESPGWIDYGTTAVFTRTVNVVKEPAISGSIPANVLRVAPDSVNVVLRGQGELKKENGFWVASLPNGAQTRLFISRTDLASLELLAKTVTTPLDLEPLTKGGPASWPQTVTTTSVAGKDDTAFTSDEFPLPVDNPFQSWMRAGGFDFTPDGKGAIVAMWNGDVWRVDGVMDPAPAKLTWRRIASGLFQPLGVKYRGKDLFITCRDQIAKLVDLNGDGEIDFIQCFNDDAQVTEHFHEFAMGLQTDAAGNFYYAKSGRHALDSVVPQHGTLLKVSADGTKTEILATGFRAANGVCLNDDGTFFVTDQEGFWTPKNRINRVKPGGFYGNMFGYGAPADESDSAMEQPLVWITNAKDRSPAELVWVPKNTWGALGGSLLNISYGTGRIFAVPHEEVAGQWQGAVCELPMPAFAAGVMRGRFAADGSLYTCGMFAWAGNARQRGGFYRTRPGKAPACVPMGIHAATAKLVVTFSDKLDPASVKPDAFAYKVWHLKRSANYGSNHYDEHPVKIAAATLGSDGRTVTLEIPTLTPTQCYELLVKARAAEGAEVTRSLHGTIHALSDK